MATIDRNALLDKEKLYLPDSNVLSDAQMGVVNEDIISQVGDDDSNEPEVLCKALRTIALINLSKTSGSSGIKREKSGGEEIEMFESGGNSWKTFIESLKDLCPTFGYTGLNSGLGMKISSGDKIIVNDCCTITSELYL